MSLLRKILSFLKYITVLFFQLLITGVVHDRALASSGILFLFSVPRSVWITSSVLSFLELLSSISFHHFWEPVRRSGGETTDFQMLCVP